MGWACFLVPQTPARLEGIAEALVQPCRCFFDDAARPFKLLIALQPARKRTSYRSAGLKFSIHHPRRCCQPARWRRRCCFHPSRSTCLLRRTCRRTKILRREHMTVKNDANFIFMRSSFVVNGEAGYCELRAQDTKTVLLAFERLTAVCGCAHRDAENWIDPRSGMKYQVRRTIDMSCYLKVHDFMSCRWLKSGCDGRRLESGHPSRYAATAPGDRRETRI